MDKTDINQIEAGAVAFTSIKTPEGFNWNVTFRDLDGKAVVARIIGFQDYCKDHGWTPVENFKGYQKKEKVFVEGKVCPKCGGRLVENVSKSGKKFHKCENSKWNPTTKQAYGCDYVDWLEPAPLVLPKREEPEIDISDEDMEKYIG